MSAAQSPASASTIDQWFPAKDGTQMVMHSTGRSDRSSWMAANSGWTSAQNSCSASVMANRAAASTPAGGTGCRTSVATGVRSPGSSPSSSNRIVVPERAGPVTTIGASITSSATDGSRRRCSPRRKRVRSPRISSSRVMRRPTTWRSPPSMAAVRARRRPSQSPSPRSPGSAMPVDARTASTMAPASSGTRSRAPPAAAPMAFTRRTQSGRRYLSPIGAMPMPGVNHGDGRHAERNGTPGRRAPRSVPLDPRGR